MYQIHCLNKISEIGLKHLTDEYALNDSLEAADAVLVREVLRCTIWSCRISCWLSQEPVPE